MMCTYQIDGNLAGSASRWPSAATQDYGQCNLLFAAIRSEMEVGVRNVHEAKVVYYTLNCCI